MNDAGQDGAGLLQRLGTRPMDFTGRRMRGFLQVDADGIADDETLVGWLAEATARAGGLPAK